MPRHLQLLGPGAGRTISRRGMSTMAYARAHRMQYTLFVAGSSGAAWEERFMENEKKMTSKDKESASWIAKDSLDTINSVAWFFMDAFWMLGLAKVGLFFIIPTVLTGLCLLWLEKRPVLFKINVGINCWILMNVTWMLSDAYKMPRLLGYSRGMFVVGVLFIAAAGLQSGNIRETFSHSRRFRTARWLGAPGTGG